MLKSCYVPPGSEDDRWSGVTTARPVGLALLVMLILFAMTGCSNVSRGVARDGSGAAQPVWPAPDSVTPIHKGGTFPLRTQLQTLRYGMNKQQIAALIGYPHFNEGVWNVREWNYVLNFRDEGSDSITVCQFKVLFDAKKIARSFYWLPEPCSRYMAVPMTAALVKAPEQEVTLSTDALFKFDRAAIEDITDGGQDQLDQLARDLLVREGHVRSIHIFGYADRLGTDDYDFSLSERRAYAVMSYLVSRGVPASLITAEGRGKADAVKQCPDEAHGVLVACLAPNRRVVVQVDTNGT
jgi:outer membrane protein OmpA-like peptidoglycan-associated protein